MHVFFGDMAARFIGWANSPFQAEVGFASLGFSVVGFLAFRGDIGLRKAAVMLLQMSKEDSAKILAQMVGRVRFGDDGMQDFLHAVRADL